MQYNKENHLEKIKEKAQFYFEEGLKCHVQLIPTAFINGKFLSELIEGKYYWFEDARAIGKKRRLFLIEIFEINDYEVLETK